ncbi:MAG: hypothetical protein JWR63_1785, partial [Conexibacter sp.]|nr:hypothetical protein [Conexibacter sp.]
GVALAGGTALAATTPWSPQVGDADRGQPSVARPASVPADQVASLGVLRRAQSDADRAPGVEALLKLLGKDNNDGVHLDGVRLLQKRADGITVLLPETRVDARRDVLCLLYGLDGTDATGPSAGQKCGTTADLRAGRIFLGAQHAGRLELNGLVPDGVTRVDVPLRDGKTISSDVADNAFHIDAAAADGTYEDAAMRWFGADGRRLR